MSSDPLRVAELEARAAAAAERTAGVERTKPVTDGPDPSSVLAAAERVEGRPDPPTREEREQQQLERELRDRLYGPQREEDREADLVEVDRLEWKPPEDSELRDDEDAATWFNRQLR